MWLCPILLPRSSPPYSRSVLWKNLKFVCITLGSHQFQHLLRLLTIFIIDRTSITHFIKPYTSLNDCGADEENMTEYTIQCNLWSVILVFLNLRRVNSSTTYFVINLPVIIILTLKSK